MSDSLNENLVGQIYADDEPDFDPEVFGRNLRRLREIRELSTRDLAKMAHVSRATLLRAEHGLPTRVDVRNRLCAALETRLAELCLPTVDGQIAVHRHTDEHWVLVRGLKPAPRRFSSAELEDPAERARIARLGWAARFTKLFGSILPHSPLLFGLMEVHGRQDEPTHHPGEEYLFVMSGALRVRIRDRVVDLESGDSMTFDAGDPHEYEPADPSVPALVHFGLRHGSRSAHHH